MTVNEITIAQDNESSTISVDKISHFSLRPSELRKQFDQVGNYYRWFHIQFKRLSEVDMMEMLVSDIKNSYWIDSLGFQVKYARKLFTKSMNILTTTLMVISFQKMR